MFFPLHVFPFTGNLKHKKSKENLIKISHICMWTLCPTLTTSPSCWLPTHDVGRPWVKLLINLDFQLSTSRVKSRKGRAGEACVKVTIKLITTANDYVNRQRGHEPGHAPPAASKQERWWRERWRWLVCGARSKVGGPSVQNLIMSGQKTYN